MYVCAKRLHGDTINDLFKDSAARRQAVVYLEKHLSHGVVLFPQGLGCLGQALPEDGAEADELFQGTDARRKAREKGDHAVDAEHSVHQVG
mmetsp:Transcript_67814/g.128065  ORF Transcript_67814/g.128065 Transcript_67814/m.128065 type:complete len:91 (-) Transcript_67814:324-596(-)